MAMQAENQDQQQHVYDRLQPHVEDAEVCKRLASILHSMLEPSMINRPTADHLVVQLQAYL